MILPAIGKKSNEKYLKSWLMEPLTIAVLSSLLPADCEREFFDDRIERFFYLLFQDCGGHIHTAVLHPGVGLTHGQEVLVDFRLQLLIVDGDLGPEFAFLVELFEVRNLGTDAGAVIEGNVSSIYETKPDSQGVSLA